MSLKEKLDAFRAQVESGRRIPIAVVEKLHKSTEELVASGQAERVKKAGDRAPTFELEDTNGRTINLTDLLVKGPVVLTFYRGVWCPYCNMELQALEEARRDIEARGGQLVAISMQTAPNSRRSIEQNKLGFPILIDLHGITANAYGLRFALPDYLIDIYKNVFKNDLAVINDDPSWTLPMPARYVIGQNSMIAYAEVNPDYTRRPEPVELLPVLDRLGALVA
jgi:peroxiredoxin